MLITVKESNEVWKSPDGQRSIYEIKDQDGNTWQTMSRQIAQAINQSMELTTRVSNKGKTYLIKPQDRQENAQQTLDGVSSPSIRSEDLQRFQEAVNKFDEAVNKLLLSKGLEEIAQDTDMPPAELYENLAGKEITDDL